MTKDLYKVRAEIQINGSWTEFRWDGWSDRDLFRNMSAGDMECWAKILINDMIPALDPETDVKIKSVANKSALDRYFESCNH